MCWTRNENVIWEELDRHAVLVDTRTGLRWMLNDASTAAWKLCDGTRTLTDMARLMRQNCDSLLAFLHQFETFGLLLQHEALCPKHVAFQSTAPSPFCFQSTGIGASSRRRPSPRGNSGPG